jgi:S-DNA-T family DNA segregation ATPase FtsK/SpoIIIE
MSAEPSESHAPLTLVKPEPEPKPKPGNRKPVLPEWLQNRENFTNHARRVRGHAWHSSRFHGIRSPIYLSVMLFWAVVGIAVLFVRWCRWWLFPVPLEVWKDAIADGHKAWHRAHAVHKDTTLTRAWISISVIVVLGIPLGVAIYLGLIPWWVWPLVALPAVPILAKAGRPEGARITTAARIPSQYEKLTQDVVTRALGSLGLSGIDKWLREGNEIVFTSPIRQDGPGWLAEADLPYGVTATQVLERRDRLASGLRRPLGAVWPEPVTTEHPGRLAVWVGQEDITARKPAPWPLLKATAMDVFKSVPFGTDTRGRPVRVPLVFSNYLIGSMPRNGKTCAIRQLCCAAALDPTAELWIAELKGTGDLDPLGAVSHRFISGIDEEAIAYAAESLRLLRAECEKRAPRLRELPLAICPQRKVTREIASKRSLKLWSIVCVIDEAQNLFAHEKYGKQAGTDAEFVIKVGPAMGVVLMLATQRPDARSLPTGVSANVSIRFALYLAGQVENDMVLGTSSYQNGLRATQFRPEIDAGLGILKGATPAPIVVRTYLHDVPQAQAVVARARAAREHAGTLSGYALGDDFATVVRDPLSDVLACFGPAEVALHWPVLAQRLAERFPDGWAGATADAVSADLRAAGVASPMVSVGGRKGRGCRKSEVEAVTG